MLDRSTFSHSEAETATDRDYVSLLRRRATQTPTQLAYAYLERGETVARSLDYRELDVEARRRAAALQSLGATGQRVLLLLSSDLDYVVSFFACLYAGAVAVTLDSGCSAKHLARLHSVVCDAAPTVVVSTAATRAKILANADAGHPLASLAWLYVDTPPSRAPEDWRRPPLGGDSLALLQYTSGSIADPKGVMVTHENLLFQGQYLQRLLGFSPDDVTVTWLPHFHDMGLILGVLQAAFTGFPCYLMTPPSFIKRPLAWLRALSRLGGTFSPAPNFAYDLCVQCYDPKQDQQLDLRSWRVALNGAEPVRRPTLERFAATFEPHGFDARAFCIGYGMAEATLAISTTARSLSPRSIDAQAEALTDGRVVPARADERRHAIVSCGRTVAGSEAIVVGRDLTPVPAFTIGEILVGGGSRASGYWGRPEQTRETFEVTLADGRGPYLRTGDLGFVDDTDELHVTGRAKDLLILNGKNHWPQDLELSAESCHPDVRPHFVAVFAVDVDAREQAVLAAELSTKVVDAAALEQVATTIRAAVARDHDVRLADVVFLEKGQLPKTTSGKLQRQRCRALYLRGQWRLQGATTGAATTRQTETQTCMR